MNKYVLIGHPLGHSMSPLIHKQLFSLKNRNAEYSLMDIQLDKLLSNIDFLKSIDGFNITIPYKMNIINILDKLDESALRYNSVNCVANKNGKLIGYNTDCDGFLLSIKDLPINKNVLLIGFGGVGRMFAIETLRNGGNITIAVKSKYITSTLDFKTKASSTYPNSKINVVDVENITGNFDLLINSTPSGMHPNINDCPVSDGVIDCCDSAFDAIYNPVETALLKKFKAQNKRTINGIGMLVYQAVKAHEIWNGDFYSEFEINEVIKLVEDSIT